MQQTPKVFISYCWENDPHQEWVRQLATRLRRDGIDCSLDQWALQPGDVLTQYMEQAVRDNDFVLVICTPKYKQKSDQRKGGVGYEGDIMTAEVLTKRNHRKFIPILRTGTWKKSAPTWMDGKFYIDLRGKTLDVPGYDELIQTLTGSRSQAPPLGDVPSKNNSPDVPPKPRNVPQPKPITSEPLRIVGVIEKEIGVPRNDRTPGSALYKVPFLLSAHPPRGWAEAFVTAWNNPRQFTS